MTTPSRPYVNLRRHQRRTLEEIDLALHELAKRLYYAGLTADDWDSVCSGAWGERETDPEYVDDPDASDLEFVDAMHWSP